jgi:hypothetical protein
MLPNVMKYKSATQEAMPYKAIAGLHTGIAFGWLMQ